MKNTCVGMMMLCLAVGIGNAVEPVSIPRIGLSEAVTVSEEGVWRVAYDRATPATFAVTTIVKPTVGGAVRRRW